MTANNTKRYSAVDEVPGMEGVRMDEEDANTMITRIRTLHPTIAGTMFSCCGSDGKCHRPTHATFESTEGNAHRALDYCEFHMKLKCIAMGIPSNIDGYALTRSVPADAVLGSGCPVKNPIGASSGEKPIIHDDIRYRATRRSDGYFEFMWKQECPRCYGNLWSPTKIGRAKMIRCPECQGASRGNKN